MIACVSTIKLEKVIAIIPAINIIIAKKMHYFLQLIYQLINSIGIFISKV
jgi:hypothetical protein